MTSKLWWIGGSSVLSRVASQLPRKDPYKARLDMLRCNSPEPGRRLSAFVLPVGRSAVGVV